MFKVRVESSAGTALEGNFGYVTRGITGNRVRISIEYDSIAFRQSGNSKSIKTRTGINGLLPGATSIIFFCIE